MHPAQQLQFLRALDQLDPMSPRHRRHGGSVQAATRQPVPAPAESGTPLFSMPPPALSHGRAAAQSSHAPIPAAASVAATPAPGPATVPIPRPTTPPRAGGEVVRAGTASDADRARTAVVRIGSARGGQPASITVYTCSFVHIVTGQIRLVLLTTWNEWEGGTLPVGLTEV